MARSKTCLKNIKKTQSNLAFEGLLFSSAVKNKTEKIFVTVGGLMDAKYGFRNRKLYQTVGVINLNEIKNWNEIKKSSQWVNVNFQAQGNNRDAKHFSYNFTTKKHGRRAQFYTKTNR